MIYVSNTHLLFRQSPAPGELRRAEAPGCLSRRRVSRLDQRLEQSARDRALDTRAWAPDKSGPLRHR